MQPVIEIIDDSDRSQGDDTNDHSGDIDNRVVAVDNDDAGAGDTGAVPSKNKDMTTVERHNDVASQNVIDLTPDDDRRVRRKRLLMLSQPSVVPSFTAIIAPDLSLTTSSSLYKPKRIRINVDEYLGLSGNGGMPFPDPASSSFAGMQNVHSKNNNNNSNGNNNGNARPPVTTSFSPLDEGYFEGTMSVALQDDTQYLNEFHTVTRAQLEFFSATDEDARTSRSGRRYPTVRGKVGVRCIHCAKVCLQQPHDKRSWPAGSVSYPINIAGLYPVVTQKPTLHFLNNCPHIPQDVKDRLQELTENSTVRRKNHQGGIGSITYYAIAAKRIGLIDIDSGIRFGRDIKLEPLSVESVRALVEDSGKLYRRTGGGVGSSGSSNNAAATTGGRGPGNSPATVLSSPLHGSAGAGTGPYDSSSPASSRYNAHIPVPRIAADDGSEQVLAKAVAENDKDDILGRAQDRHLVTDFIFLCIRQMALCHFAQADYTHRGQRTKGMGLGFTGFSCRHCRHLWNPETTPSWSMTGTDTVCRSFVSAADHLASAVSSSFYSHLQKCMYVPMEFKKALTAYKKLHSRQMAQVPHGSQRKLFLTLWDRLRAADIPEDIMKAKMDEIAKQSPPPPPPPQPPFPSSVLSTTANVGAAGAGQTSNSTGTQPATVEGTLQSLKPSIPTGPLEERPLGFPSSTDPNTIQVLQAAKDNTDYSNNDYLISPAEYGLVSDYVFLMMRQLKVAIPTAQDFVRGRRSTVLNVRQAGLGCIYCSTGKSFPSLPDNIASSLNTSLLSHFQRCERMPANTIRALLELKKLHSTQCASLRFGAQRRFFNAVFQRLQTIHVKDSQGLNVHLQAKAIQPVRISFPEMLRQYSFVRVLGDLYECTRCRAVPVAFRATGALLSKKPTEGQLKTHSVYCRKNSMDLSAVVVGMQTILKENPSIPVSTFQSDQYKTIVGTLVGDNKELMQLFTETAVDQLQNTTTTTRNEKEQVSTAGLWRHLPIHVDGVAVDQQFAALVESLGNFAGTNLTLSLRENHSFVHLFQLISPTFELPAEAAPVSGSEETAVAVTEETVAEPVPVSTVDTVKDVNMHEDKEQVGLDINNGQDNKTGEETVQTDTDTTMMTVVDAPTNDATTSPSVIEETTVLPP